MGLVDRRSSIIDHRSLGPNLTAGNERSRVAGETVRREGRWTSGGCALTRGEVADGVPRYLVCRFREPDARKSAGPVRRAATGNRTKPNRTAVARRKPSQSKTGRPQSLRLFSTLLPHYTNNHRPAYLGDDFLGRQRPIAPRKTFAFYSPCDILRSRRLSPRGLRK